MMNTKNEARSKADDNGNNSENFNERMCQIMDRC